MGNLLMRRREMMIAGIYPIAPLPTGSGRLAGTGGNIVQYTYSSAGTRYLYLYQNKTGSNSTANNTSAVRFRIPAGTTATISFECLAKSGSTALVNAYYRVSGTTTNKGVGTFSSNLNAVGQVRTCTITPEEEIVVGDLILRMASATAMTIKVTLFIGDVQYI